ncbi:N/A [soil metagenome]
MFLITVVLYNKSFDSSDTLKGLMESAEYLKSINAAVFLWDNSNSAYSNQNLAFLQEKLSVEYYHAPENKPLSFIYNKAVSKLLALQQYSRLILLDDDSKISVAYFKEAVETINAYPALDILLPVVRNNNKIISPAKFYYLKGSYFKTIGSGIYKEKLFAINSGMIISRNFLRQYNFRYDERLANYGTDNYIMNFANDRKIAFYIMRYTMEHSLSFFDHPDINRRLEIFRQIKKANRIVFSTNKFQVVMISWYNFVSSLKNAIKYKSLKFFS